MYDTATLCAEHWTDAMESATLTRPDQARRLLLWTLLLLVPSAILIVSLFVMTARHNAQLREQAEAHNAQLMEMTAVHNLQLTKMTEEDNLQRTKMTEENNLRLKKMTEEHNAQLAAQAAEFQKRK
jgi:hypothetical protein